MRSSGPTLDEAAAEAAAAARQDTRKYIDRICRAHLEACREDLDTWQNDAIDL